VAKIKDLAGMVFGKLRVIEVAERRSSTYYWRCRCDCGNIKVIRGSHLSSGNTVSCGCNKNEFEDLTGKRFGRLTVVAYHNFRKKRRGKMHYWECVCECGTKKVVEGNCLRSGNTKSCGCLQIEVTVERSTIHGLKPRNGYNPKYYQLKKKDAAYRLRKNISCLIWGNLKKNGGSKNGSSIFDYLPYSLQDLKSHLEDQFEDWMNWDNYGPEWHLDHIIPQSDLACKEFLECWSLENLQPLSKEDNLKKGASYNGTT